MLGELGASVNASLQEEAHLGRGLPGSSFLGRAHRSGELPTPPSLPTKWGQDGDLGSEALGSGGGVL